MHHLVIHYLSIVHLMKRKNKLSHDRGKNCMKNICQDLKKAYNKNN